MLRWGRRLNALALCCLLLLGQPGWAAAAEIGSDLPPAIPVKSQPDASDIPSERVSKFVQAYLAIVDLVGKWETDLQRAETETESIQLQEKIQAEAYALIEQAGLTQPEYWQLLGLANTDPDFRERVLAQVEETNL
ncbi:DUF4168 domain-containing protein [Pseudanabaena sp. FACHB-2040]|uniref:DUF4168 domain-containing protein n=1 Tax=Pseudanabaena sp. FACHB-2040 TaxID=2692859 RepID=UPI0016866335|nr:DUF4168 domain-containing protein [Pseudanabaena sp. FACHB-2040]MBD2257460.1 DUF4168 domain-containing protein [Pseudanabaena sp. FACHB-2040]